MYSAEHRIILGINVILTPEVATNQDFKAGFILGRFLNDFGDQNNSRTILVGAPIFGRFLNVFWSCVYL